MRLPLSMLKRFLPLRDMKVDKIVEILSEIGIETENVLNLGGELKKVVVGEVIKKEKHPNANKLNYCQVDVGDSELLNIVCGADNFSEHDKVPVVLIGGELSGGVKIKKTKIRGLESQGMICSTVELGLEKEDTTCHGIMVLDRDAPVGESFSTYMGLDDPVLELELTANRGDLLSVKGVARDLSAKLDLSLYPLEKLPLGEVDGKMGCKVKIEAPEGCNRYILKTLSNVKNSPSPWWLKVALLKLGLNPISYIVDITNYILFEMGQPMHAFDLDKLEGDIVVRYARDGEKFKALDGKELELETTDLVIADSRGPIALAGVIGGWDSQVDLNTQRVALEFAHFDPVLIRKTAKKYGYHTDSSHRFERFVDPEGLVDAVARALYFYADVSQIDEGYMDVYPHKFVAPKIPFRKERLDALIGKEYEREKVETILSRLGFKKEELEGKIYYFPPSYRLYDVQREVDLIEEIARIDGYNNFDAAFVAVKDIAGGFNPEREKLRKVKSFLLGLNLDEAMSFSFGNKDYYKMFFPEAKMIHLKNPLTEEFSTMRPYIFPNLLQAVIRNESLGEEGMAFSEVGKVFSLNDASKYTENNHLAIVLTDEVRDFFWNVSQRKNDFFTLKGIVENLNQLFEEEFIWENEAIEFLHPGISGGIYYKGEKIGFAGQLHPDIQEELEIKEKVYLLEMDLDIPQLKKNLLPRFTLFSKYPGSYRDLALVVPYTVPYAKVKEVIEIAGRPHLKRVFLFDYYEGKHVPEGHRSLGVRMFFQSDQKTLKDKEINKLFSKIEKTLEVKLGIRKREE